MVNFTRLNLFNKIRQDFGRNGNPNSDHYTTMAEESFFNLIGVKKEEATPKLARDVLEIVTDFVSKMRRRWNDPKIGRDIDKLKKKDKTFLDQYFQLPDLATKKQGMKKQNAAKSGEAQPKAEAPTVAPKPPQKRPLDDDSVPFLDKVKCIKSHKTVTFMPANCHHFHCIFSPNPPNFVLQKGSVNAQKHILKVPLLWLRHK